MGIEFITAKAKKFRHQRDAAFEEQLASENLFSGLPDTVEPTYRCKSTVERVPDVGTMVLLHDANNAISVFHVNIQIGVVMASDSREVLALMRKAETEVFAAQVVEAQPMSKTFLVRLQSSGS